MATSGNVSVTAWTEFDVSGNAPAVNLYFFLQPLSPVNASMPQVGASTAHLISLVPALHRNDQSVRTLMGNPSLNVPFEMIKLCAIC